MRGKGLTTYTFTLSERLGDMSLPAFKEPAVPRFGTVLSLGIWVSKYGIARCG